MSACILRGKAVGEEVKKLRSGYTKLHYCFDDADVSAALDALAAGSGM